MRKSRDERITVAFVSPSAGSSSVGGTPTGREAVKNCTPIRRENPFQNYLKVFESEVHCARKEYWPGTTFQIDAITIGHLRSGIRI